jgi:hypothetical protein
MTRHENIKALIQAFADQQANESGGVFGREEPTKTLDQVASEIDELFGHVE